MEYLIKRPVKLNGKTVQYWTVRWAGTDGKTRQKSLGRVDKMPQSKAKRLRDEFVTQLATGQVSRDPAKPMTLEVFFEYDQQAPQADVQPTTLLEYKIAAKHAQDAIGGQTMVASVTRAHVGRIKTHLLEKGRATATIAKVIRTLKGIFGRAKAEGLIINNPFTGQKAIKVQAKQKRIFSREEIDKMVEAAPDQWWRTFIRLAADTGLRKGELLNTHWRDIDFDGKTITVSAKRSGSFEAGGADYPIIEWSSKSHQERRVPLTAATVSELQRMKLTSGGSVYVLLSLERLNAIWPRLAAGRLPATANLVNNTNRRFEQIQGAARTTLAKQHQKKVKDVEWPIGTIHDLRKSYATHMAQHVAMHELRDLLGHFDITVTAAYYTAVTDTLADRVRTALAG